MGSAAKRNQKSSKYQHNLRPRTTRSSKGRLLSDPAHNTQLLTEQLRSLGLYPANTLGDGNCLFRALSDQLYGTPSHHVQLRRDICDWIEGHKEHYQPFVEDDRGIDEHLRCMRENATYGGHVELSAFAHFARRNVKVVQPGLVYVIEWEAGGLHTPDSSSSSSFSSSPPSSSSSSMPTQSSDSDRRRGKKTKKVIEQKSHPHTKGPPVADDEEDDEKATSESTPPGPIYVAYHDWEHFSSIRNLRGPHTGLPMVVETPAEDIPEPPSPLPKPSSSKKQRVVTKVKLKLSPSSPVVPTTASAEPPLLPSLSSTLMTSAPTSSASASSTAVAGATLRAARHPRIVDLDPTRVPLPDSRDASPRRSPKRTFDESEAETDDHLTPSGGVESVAKRTRGALKAQEKKPHQQRKPRPEQEQGGEVDKDGDVDMRLSPLSSASSSDSSASESSKSPSPSPTPSSSSRSRSRSRSSNLRPSRSFKDVDGGSKKKKKKDGDDVSGFGSGMSSPLSSPPSSQGDLEKSEEGAVVVASSVPLPSSSSSLSVVNTRASARKLAAASATAASAPTSAVVTSPPGKQSVVGAGAAATAGKKQVLQQRPMTRRQRKLLGLPKSREALVAAVQAKTVSGRGGGKGSGKILIPGGKSSGWKGKEGGEDGEEEEGEGEGEEEETEEVKGEWIRNGVGRVDVRGFRELRI